MRSWEWKDYDLNYTNYFYLITLVMWPWISFQFPGPLRYSCEFKLISDQESGIRGSCPSYHVRKNISEEIRGSLNRDCLDLKTAYERYVITVGGFCQKIHKMLFEILCLNLGND